MTDQRALVASRDQRQVVHPVADGLPALVAQDGADGVTGSAGPPLPGAEHVPAAVHAQVAVQGELRGDPGQQVLADRDHGLHPVADQVDGGQCWHPQVEGRQVRAGEGDVQRARSAPDDIAFGHRCA